MNFRFDLLASPQCHQFDPSLKVLLAFCSAHHPRQVDMPHLGGGGGGGGNLVVNEYFQTGIHFRKRNHSHIDDEKLGQSHTFS